MSGSDGIAPIVVTGSHGFIGARVARLLSSRHPVRAFVRRDAAVPGASERVVCDLGWPFSEALLDGATAVVHAAGLAHVSPSTSTPDGFVRANVDTTRRLARACVVAGVRRFVLVSSVSVYGDAAGEGDDEDPVCAPVDAYGQSKLDAEHVLHESGVSEPVVIRFPLVYGPGLPGNLARMIRAVRAHRFPPPPSTGNSRSMIHVDDAAAAIALAVDRKAAAGKTYVVTDGRSYSTREIYNLIRGAIGRRPTRLGVPMVAFRAIARAGDIARALGVQHVPFDSRACRKLLGDACFRGDAITRDLGFVPRRDLPDSIESIVRSLGR